MQLDGYSIYLMRTRFFFLLIYFGLLVTINILFYSINLVFKIDWLPYPTIILLLLLPLFFVVLGAFISYIFKRIPPYLVISVTWILLSAIILLLNSFHGFELLQLINGHIAYPIRLIDYQFKMKFNIVGIIEELVVAFPIVFIYHYFVGKLAYKLSPIRNSQKTSQYSKGS